jgi:hypothetical protein
MKRSKITDIILDFDGTCTQIPELFQGFQDSYFQGFAKQMDNMHQPITKKEWEDTIDIVSKNSPHAGWTVAECPSAPAAADPYIRAYEVARFILRSRQSLSLPDFKIFEDAYTANPPKWRTEAESIFIDLQKRKINLYFISNTSTKKIQDRLQDLKGVGPITVQGGAAKFGIRELTWDPPKPGDELPPKVKKQFTKLPVSYKLPKASNPGRPVYLRRGSYFESICKVFNNNLSRLASTVFCGDIWELDLALPYSLGANVHLIERATPFDTYTYERDIVSGYDKQGKIGKDLSSLLEWFK